MIIIKTGQEWSNLDDLKYTETKQLIQYVSYLEGGMEEDTDFLCIDSLFKSLQCPELGDIKTRS